MRWKERIWNGYAAHRVGYRFVVLVILISALFTIIATGVQMYAEYRQGMETIKSRLLQSQKINGPSLANALWTFDEGQIKIIMHGILQVPDVQYVEVRTSDGEFYRAGNPAENAPSISRSFPIIYAPNGQMLGTMKIDATPTGIYQRIVERIQIIAGTHAVRMLVVAIAFLFVFRRLVARHLDRMAGYARQFRLDRLNVPLTLNRPVSPHAPDELEQVVNGVNEMRETLLQEMSRRAHLANELTLERNLLATILNTTGALIILADTAGRIARLNQAAARACGYSEEEIAGTFLWEVFFLPNEATLLKSLLADLQQQTQGVQYYGGWIPREGTQREALWSITYLAESPEGSPYIVCTGIDITELKQAQQRAHYLSNYDGLTGLPNRLLLHDLLQQAISQAERVSRQLAVLMLRLGRIDDIRHTLGRKIANALLQQVTQRLQNDVTGEATVARASDENFGVFCDMADSRAVLSLVQSVAKSLEQPFQIEQHEIYLKPHIGIALYPLDATDADQLLQNAEVALQRAVESKTQAQPHQFFTRAFNERANQRWLLEKELRQALQHGEFRLYYQPQVGLASGKVVGVEALIRWLHPSHGIVNPADFIPAAEEMGLITGIGEWALREACRQNKAWQDEGIAAITMSVNLSFVQCTTGDIIDVLDSALAETKLDPRHLEIEITESLSMEDPDHTIRLMQKINDRGISLAIDDFGTGYSNLGYLKRFPVKKLKIDKSFVNDIAHDVNDLAICNAIIAIAHVLGLKVVAEGVETERQLKLLVKHHCDQVQGYYFSQPLSAAECTSLLVSPECIWHGQDVPVHEFQPGMT
ncbi:EAL domain-containing protein [Noviherbaspirillum sedimenti]|uniref:EAL domain-containing protein n=1 Tax=Noviherbaspirillum sedimenti TaxID=2320865 RepID=A0A3A3GLF2_9BURK|nr:EAL domain-containing protein [Noviherbaspirillum sedimenti]RJG01790.1 EAL domain-containing protein [Noviherbaspirillum sedimenti]